MNQADGDSKPAWNLSDEEDFPSLVPDAVTKRFTKEKVHKRLYQTNPDQNKERKIVEEVKLSEVSIWKSICYVINCMFELRSLQMS